MSLICELCSTGGAHCVLGKCDSRCIASELDNGISAESSSAGGVIATFSLRNQVLHRSFASKRSLKPKKRAFVDVVLRHLWETYGIDGKDRFRLEAVSVAFLQPMSAKCLFRQWLIDNEKGRGVHQDQNTCVMYQEFHSAKMFRVFISRVHNALNNVTVAGSFAMAR